MSKKQQSDYYYSFTAPPVQESSSSRFLPSSQPDTAGNSSPPAYDEASFTQNNLPPNKNSFEGYILDSTNMHFNPHITIPQTQQPRYTSDYDQIEPDVHPDAPLLNEDVGNNFAGRPAPPGYALYRAKYENVKAGVLSRDDHINEDGEALLQFLYEHNKAPRMVVNIFGYHDETTWRTESTRNENGELVEERVSSTNRVTDFLFDIDCSSNIAQECQGVYILPNPKTGEQQTLRQLCDDYVHSKNQLKELKLTKEVNWDYNGLTRAITTAIRDSGFYENVDITFKTEDHEIVVKSNSSLSRYMDHIVFKIFLFISCTWIIVLPLVYLFKEKFGHSTLKSAWDMNISERDWYTAHIGGIVNSCRTRNILGSRSILSHTNQTSHFSSFQNNNSNVDVAL